jgi:hypothetical protein
MKMSDKYKTYLKQKNELLKNGWKYIIDDLFLKYDNGYLKIKYLKKAY